MDIPPKNYLMAISVYQRVISNNIVNIPCFLLQKSNNSMPTAVILILI